MKSLHIIKYKNGVMYSDNTLENAPGKWEESADTAMTELNKRGFVRVTKTIKDTEILYEVFH